MLLNFNQILSDFNLKPKNVLHVGAWDGIEAVDYHNAGVEYALFIEAQFDIFSTLLARTAPFGYEALNYCVSDRDEKVNFRVTSNGQSSSILELGTHSVMYPEITVVDEMVMNAKTIENIIFNHNINKEFDFVNMDIQGAELKAIKGMGDVIDHVDAFYLEVNKTEVYKGCALVGDIDKYLTPLGFTRVLTGHWIEDSWTDALYLRQ